MKLINAIATATAALIGTSIVCPTSAELKIINVPCADGGGSAGWTIPER